MAQVSGKVKVKLDTKTMRRSLENAIKMYHDAVKLAPDTKETASLHKNLTKAHELIITTGDLEVEMKLYHFGKMIRESSKALKLGHVVHTSKWVRQLVERGHDWDNLLVELLKD